MLIGQSITRIDAEAKVTGKARYPADFDFPNQLYMKVLFAHRPHAIVKGIDVSAAEALEGVLAVLTAKDVVKDNIYGHIIPDQPILCGPGTNNPYGDRVRFIGDHLALVIAESEEIAAKARDLVQVVYQDLPVVGSIEEALDENAPILHPDKGSDNVFCTYRIQLGDVEKAFEACDVIVEGEYQTPVQEHAFLQPEAGVAYYDEEGRITIVVAGQDPHHDREQIARALDMPEEQIRVIYPAIGGAFGGREDASVQIILGLAALRLHQRGIDRPIKIVWSREESIIGHGKRHAYKLKAKWGATSDGLIKAAKVDVYGDGGAYAYTSTLVLGNTTLMCPGPYEIPNVSIEAHVVHTNNVPGAAFRGFGGPQGAFVAETQVNRLADALGMDRVAFRLKNLIKEESLLSVRTPIPKGVSIKQVVTELAKTSGWRVTNTGWKKPSVTPMNVGVIKRGRGIACGFKNVGYSSGGEEFCTAVVELHGGAQIEKAILYHGGAEVGQGSHTVFKQIAADGLGISVEKVALVASDTATSQYAGSVSASRMTFMGGNAIRGAVVEALEKWRQEDRPAKAAYIYRPPVTTPYAPQTGESMPNFAYGYVAEVVDLEVDTETGEICILKVICANDVGKAINPQQIQGQMDGAIVQAAGYVLMENYVQKDGYVLSDKLSTYLIPTVLDVPEVVESLILEYPDPIGPYGARGMGEMPFMPLAPAIIDAMHDAIGVWFHEFPLTPERVLRGLGKL